MDPGSDSDPLETRDRTGTVGPVTGRASFPEVFIDNFLY